jgi:predicted PurR-regulated permease PerM
MLPVSGRWADSREHIFFIVCAVVCGFIIWPIVLPLASGAAVAYICEKPLTWMMAFLQRSRFLQMRFFKGATGLARSLLALFLIVFILLLFLVPMALFVVTTIKQAALLFDSQANPLLQPGLFDRGVQWIAVKLGNLGLTLSVPDIIEQTKLGLSRISGAIMGNLQSFLTGTPEGLVNAAMFLMSWFVFLVQGPALRAFVLPKILPWENERRILCDTTGDVLRAVILSNILVSLVQSAVVFGFLSATSTPQVLLWSGLAFFLSFIPLLGTAPIMIGAALHAFWGDRMGACIALTVGTIVVGSIDNVLRPFFVKGGAELNFFWVFVAFVGGIAQFGIAGTVLGPLAFSLFVAASRAVEERGRSMTEDKELAART